MTKKGKTISVDSEDNWSYQTPNLSITQNADGKVNYSIQSMSRSEIVNMQSPSEKINSVEEEIKEVKKLTRTIFDRSK